MKTTKIPFCRTIPDSWNEIPNRYLFEEHSFKVGEKSSEYQLLSLTTSGVKEKDTSIVGGKTPESYDNYQTVEKGDMIFCLFDLDCSAVFSGLSNYNGMITSAYDVFRPNPKYVEQHFLDYWFQYVFSNRYYKMYSKNIRYTVTREMFNGVSTPVPPLAKQKKIGEFLDQKCAQIDALILNQERQIEKLKQYKQALITEVVTKGLDPTVPMKDSGVEWIGEIPEHWKIVRFRYLADITTGDQDTQNADPNGAFPFYVRSPNVEKSNSYTFEGDGILMAGDGAGAGRVFHFASGKYAVHQRVYRFYNFKHIDPALLKYYLENMFCRVMDYGSAKTTVPSVRLPMIQNFCVCIPTSSEQNKILAFLANKCAKLDTLIASISKKQWQLNQYKKSLIYEYVTGKKEVV